MRYEIPIVFIKLGSIFWAALFRARVCSLYHGFGLFSLIFMKGIVHPKMKILSSITDPNVVPNLYECLCSAEHKARYSEECGKQSSYRSPLTSIVFFFPTMEVKSTLPQNRQVTNFLQNILLCVRQNKEIHTGE